MQITDRAKDVIKSGGEWISSVELENIAVGCPGVAEAGAIGIPHPKFGEAVKAVVVLEPGATITEADLIAAVRTRKGAVQAPKSVSFVDALPLSAVGKPDKKVLRVQFADEMTEA